MAATVYPAERARQTTGRSGLRARQETSGSASVRSRRNPSHAASSSADRWRHPGPYVRSRRYSARRPHAGHTPTRIERAPPHAQQAEPERAELPGEEGNDLAWEIASENDSEWAGSGSVETRWVRIVDADENEVDGFVFDDETVRGYAPDLIARENESSPTRMRGVLRRDVVKRRKPGRFDTATPM